MEILDEILSLADEAQSLHLQRFFRTGKGEYGEGDIFLGIKVESTRSIVKKYYKSISLNEIEELIKNPYHEVRSIALQLMVLKYEKLKIKDEIFELYLKNVHYINNWDLVDISAPKILGNFVFINRNFDVINTLADSNHLWSERIAVVSQLYFIKHGEFEGIIKLCEKFLTHKHDLMHKACGWMLREVGKVDEKVLCCFLDKNYKIMPRTMLRYSIERLDEAKRKYYMTK